MSDTLVSAVIGGFIALAAATIGLLGKQVFDRRTESSKARRTLYVELMTVLMGRREYMREAIWSAVPKQPDLPTARIDNLNALLAIDAGEKVAAQARVCFALLNTFGVSRSMNVPVEVTERGTYRHRFDLMQNDSEEGRAQTMRIALSDIFDEYEVALSALGDQIKREVHRRF